MVLPLNVLTNIKKIIVVYIKFGKLKINFLKLLKKTMDKSILYLKN